MLSYNQEKTKVQDSSLNEDTLCVFATTFSRQAVRLTSYVGNNVFHAKGGLCNLEFTNNVQITEENESKDKGRNPVLP